MVNWDEPEQAPHDQLKGDFVCHSFICGTYVHIPQVISCSYFVHSLHHSLIQNYICRCHYLHLHSLWKSLITWTDLSNGHINEGYLMS